MKVKKISDVAEGSIGRNRAKFSNASWKNLANFFDTSGKKGEFIDQVERLSCSETGKFSRFFNGIAGARKMKNGSELCARLCENGRITKKNKGAALDPPYNGMGKAPLPPSPT